MTDPRCMGCKHAVGIACLRECRFGQSYELKYTDSDFCGPNARHWEPRTVMSRIVRLARNVLAGGKA